MQPRFSRRGFACVEETEKPTGAGELLFSFLLREVSCGDLLKRTTYLLDAPYSCAILTLREVCSCTAFMSILGADWDARTRVATPKVPTDKVAQE